MNFDWNDLAFATKKPLNALQATFIAAPRELSAKRLTDLVKTYLPHGNLVIGVAKEPYVLGLEDQPQFSMLPLEAVQPLINRVNARKPKFTVSTLSYFQRDLRFLLEQLNFTRVLFVNGSWYKSLHYRPEFYTLVNRGIPLERISPFVDEAEARTYATDHQPAPPTLPKEVLSEGKMLGLADAAAHSSFSSADLQTGAALGLRSGRGYKALATTFNRVVPFQTYAWHYGAAREQNYAPMHDLNHYDTNHAEIELLVEAQQRKLSLAKTTLFINLSPCPPCARMLSRTDIAEVVYREDHSDGYAYKLLAEAGKKMRRVV